MVKKVNFGRTNFNTHLIQIMSTKDQIREDVTIRFAGDSGDGMQLTGSLFTNTTALLGNDLRTLPEFPAEIGSARYSSRSIILSITIW